MRDDQRKTQREKLRAVARRVVQTLSGIRNNRRGPVVGDDGSAFTQEEVQAAERAVDRSSRVRDS